MSPGWAERKPTASTSWLHDARTLRLTLLLTNDTCRSWEGKSTKQKKALDESFLFFPPSLFTIQESPLFVWESRKDCTNQKGFTISFVLF